MIAASESAEQRAVIEWAKYHENRWPELTWLHHIPNVRANKYQRMNLAREGVKAGVADLFLPSARLSFHGLYIEMKVKGGRVRPEQRAFIDFANRQGYYAVVCYGADEAIAELEAYLSQPRHADQAHNQLHTPTRKR